MAVAVAAADAAVVVDVDVVKEEEVASVRPRVRAERQQCCEEAASLVVAEHFETCAASPP